MWVSGHGGQLKVEGPEASPFTSLGKGSLLKGSGAFGHLTSCWGPFRGDRHSGSKAAPSSLPLPAPLQRQPRGGRTELSSANSNHLELLTL